MESKNVKKDKVTFELKHGFYAIIKMKDNKFLQTDIPVKTFEKALVFAYELTETLPSAVVVHLGNYDAQREMEGEK